ncbi:hypothetical protein [Alistipes sp. cv1]|uniref:hypothetical protein n=1 Tax=Alistipes sp. cv1 TaxID=1622071 RepID=UPI000C77E081|nr:hypothetical protein [Alistipes sp. cv1]
MNTMIQVGSEITIVPCKELDNLRLSDLAGRRAVVTEDLTIPERRERGYMVRLVDGDYMDEENWFIPAHAAYHA